MRYSQVDTMAALMKYSGDDEIAACNISALLATDEADAGAVTDSVARLANQLPRCGPVLALEIVSAVARAMAKGGVTR